MDYASVTSHAYTSPSSHVQHENNLPDNKPTISSETGVFLISSSDETELDEPLSIPVSSHSNVTSNAHASANPRNELENVIQDVKQSVINKVLFASEVISLLSSSDDDEVDKQFCRANVARQNNTSADVHSEHIQPEIKPVKAVGCIATTTPCPRIHYGL